MQIADALYYNASLTLNILQKLGVATEIFNLWFQMLQQTKKSGARANFKRWLTFSFSCKFEKVDISTHAYILYGFSFREHDKKVCCLGLTSLIPLPAEQLPREALERVFKANLDLLVAYKDQVAGWLLDSHFSFQSFFLTDIFVKWIFFVPSHWL